MLLLPVSSKIGSKTERVTTKDFRWNILSLLRLLSIDFNSNRKSVNKIVEINVPLQRRKSLYYYFFVINDNKIFLAPASLSSTACSTAYFTLHSIALDSSNKALAFSTFSTIL